MNNVPQNEESPIDDLTEEQINDMFSTVDSMIETLQEKIDNLRKISDRKKQEWKDGIYDIRILEKATLKAAEKVSGSCWYTDGTRDYRLSLDQDRSGLRKGRSNGRHRKTKITTT